MEDLMKQTTMKKIFAIIALCCFTCIGSAQTDAKQRFEQLRSRQQRMFVQKRSQQQQRFDQIRRDQNKRYVEFMRKNWEKMGISPAIQQVQEEEFVPMVYQADSISQENETSLVVIHENIQAISHDSIEINSIHEIQSDQSEVSTIASHLEQDTILLPDVELDTVGMQEKIDTPVLNRVIVNDILMDSILNDIAEKPQMNVDSVLVHDTILPIEKKDMVPAVTTLDTVFEIATVDTISESKFMDDTIADTPLENDTIVKNEMNAIVDTNLISQRDPIMIEEQILYLPDPEPQPQPIVPIMPIQQDVKRVDAILFGTKVSIEVPVKNNLSLKSVTESSIADVWEQLTDSTFDIAITSCLANRDNLNLCDWGYFRLVQSFAKELYGDTNEAVLFTAYILAQSGYKVRVARSEYSVYMLLASHYEIYGLPFFTLDDERFYLIDGQGETNLYICDAMYDKEQKLSLRINAEQRLNYKPSDIRTLISKKGVSAIVRVNKNMIDFFSDYPAGCKIDDLGTKWSTHVTTPLDNSIKQELYPQLVPFVTNQTAWQSVNLLLNWTQTAFDYKYDNEVWGEDRVFFTAETLHYPYSDCEDRSILFATLVRDLLGLEVVLLYFPNHLATAVHIPDDMHEVDHVMYNNKRFAICDPTFINAPAGKQMPCFKGVKPQVIVID